VLLPEFAKWCVDIGQSIIGQSIPQELAALAKDNPQAAPAATVEALLITTPAADEEPDPDEKLSALFDPVPAEALEKMFPAKGKWKSWAEKAKSNGLIDARIKRGMFNPYKAAVWFVNRGMEGWDLSRCYRTLANNLPARSIDDKHLLTHSLN
jgi:hypothetical protein